VKKNVEGGLFTLHKVEILGFKYMAGTRHLEGKRGENCEKQEFARSGGTGSNLWGGTELKKG